MKSKPILSILACGAALLLSPALKAQDASPSPSTTGTEAGHQWGHRGGGPGNGEGMLKKLTDDLGLTPDQVAKIKPIIETFRSTVQPLRQDTTLQPKDKMAKIKEARETEISGIKAVLTPDQQAKFDTLQQQMREHRGGKRGGAEGAPAGSPAASPAAAQ
jgi:Spy/CpxP family protein refolding chaperone